MARRTGGGNVAEQYLRTGLSLLLTGAVGVAVIVILASVLGQVTSQFPVTAQNPLYNATRAWQTVMNTISNFINPLILVGIAVLLIIGVSVLLRVFL